MANVDAEYSKHSVRSICSNLRRKRLRISRLSPPTSRGSQCENKSAVVCAFTREPTAVSWAFAREFDQLQPDEHGYGGRAARTLIVLERCELRPRPESLLPLVDRVPLTTNRPRDRGIAPTAPSEKYDSSPLNQARHASSRPHDRLKLPAHRRSKLQRTRKGT